VKQLVSFRSLGDSAHASIEQQIGELAAHHPKRDLHPSSTELVSLRAGVERDTLCSGDAYRVKLRLVLSTAPASCRGRSRTRGGFQRLREHPGISIEEGALHRYAGWDPRRSRRGEQQILGFWQPDETLKVEDALPGSGEEREEAASEHEVRSLTGKLLSQLPAWRHAVLPVQVDDVPLREVVVRLDTDEATVRRGLEHADAFLRTVGGTGCHGNNGSIDVPSTGLPRFECSASPARKQGDIGISIGTDISTHPLPAREAMPSRTKRSSSWPSAVFVESPQPRRSRSPKTANAVS
jgi:hypothetical protein